MSSERVFLALGSNVGDRHQQLIAALKYVQQKVKLRQVSSIYTSQPMYLLDQAEFYNLVVEVTTTLSPAELLSLCQETERVVGRVIRQRNGPREIDVDIVFYGDQSVGRSELIIPHQRVTERPFVLVPLAEIAPEFAHPQQNKTIRQLVQELGEYEPLIINLSAKELAEKLKLVSE